MSDWAEWEEKLYHQLTWGGPKAPRRQLSIKTADSWSGALRSVKAAAGGNPHAAAALIGVSRETWRRWNLPAGAHLSQRPKGANLAKLLNAARAARLRPGVANKRPTIEVTSRYPTGRQHRSIDAVSLQWSEHGMAKVVTAFLGAGMRAAVEQFLLAIEPGGNGSGGFYREWLDPDNTTEQGFDIDDITLRE